MFVPNIYESSIQRKCFGVDDDLPDNGYCYAFFMWVAGCWTATRDTREVHAEKFKGSMVADYRGFSIAVDAISSQIHTSVITPNNMGCHICISYNSYQNNILGMTHRSSCACVDQLTRLFITHQYHTMSPIFLVYVHNNAYFSLLISIKVN